MRGAGCWGQRHLGVKRGWRKTKKEKTASLGRCLVGKPLKAHPPARSQDSRTKEGKLLAQSTGASKGAAARVASIWQLQK